MTVCTCGLPLATFSSFKETRNMSSCQQSVLSHSPYSLHSAAIKGSQSHLPPSTMPCPGRAELVSYHLIPGCEKSYVLNRGCDISKQNGSPGAVFCMDVVLSGRSPCITFKRLLKPTWVHWCLCFFLFMICYSTTLMISHYTR